MGGPIPTLLESQVAGNAFWLFLPGIVTATTAVLVLLVDAVLPRRRAVLAWVAAAGLVAAAAVALGQWMTWKGGWALYGVFTGKLRFSGRAAVAGFHSMVSMDQYTLFFVVLFCVIGVVSIMLSDDYLKRHHTRPGEFYALLLMVVTGMIGMAASTDLIALFVSFELMSLPTYVLAGSLNGDRRSGEASLKYFVNGAFSSAILVFGMALLYGLTGATSYALLHAQAGVFPLTSGLGIAGLVLVITGFGFKIAAVPFHGWAPDVYEGAPTPFTAFMSVGIKAAAFAGLMRLFGVGLMHGSLIWTDALIVLAVLTMVVGNVLALPQRNVKRMLAYSSIAHAGYLLLGVIAMGRAHSSGGVSAVLFYLVAYAFMNLGAFGILVLIRNRQGEFHYRLDEIGGLGKRMPVASLAMTLFMLSLTGIPPLAGFWGKFFIFAAAVDAHLWWLVVIAVIMSAVSAFYYLRVVWYMYFREAAGAEPALERTSAGMRGSLAVAALGVVVIGLYPQPVIAAAQNALRILLGG
jgi:NADH-quinone oxidoreductase subunit N